MRQQLLLLEDVDALGKKGEIVTAKPGYVRNFLLPQGLAMIASPHTLRKQEALRAERAKQAVIDRKESEEMAVKVEQTPLEIRVKVDPEGHMYGSVSAADVAALFQENGLAIEKKSVLITKPIKETGTHNISIKLKEGITATAALKIIPEGMKLEDVAAVTAPLPVEEKEAEQSE